jgi:ribosomal protein S18 acetylase RimI-like enzyme
VLEAKRTTDAGLGQFLGAFRGGELVAALGIVSDGAATARYQNVMTHPDHRRQGLAGHLVAAAAAEANRRWSADRLVIAADPDGPAVGLYRRLGFQDTEFEVQLARS